MTPDLRQEIRTAQEGDNGFQEFKRKLLSKEGTDFKEGEYGMLYFRERICVLDVGQLRKQILNEAHKSKYAIHPGEVKMYKDLKRVY
jgi:hypothetical protein